MLLRPLSTLGKLKAPDANVSFLRRTEYISSHALKARPDPRRSADPFLRQKRPEKRKMSPEPDKGTPAWIKRRIEKSFEAAARNMADKSRVRHPTKRNVKLVEALPVVPDNDAFPDSGAYVTVKFSTNPVGATDRYDGRLMAGIFKPIERSAAEDEEYDRAVAAWERDPRSNPKPHNMMNYNLFLAKDGDTAARFRRRFDVDDSQKDDDGLYPEGGAFSFPRLRAYETSHEKEMDHQTKYDDEVILAFREADDVVGGKVVFYYPIMQRSTIRNQRARNIARTNGLVEDEEPVADELRVTVTEPSDELREDLIAMRENPLGAMYDEEEEEEEQQVEPRRETNGSTAANGGQLRASDHEQDAEGDEEE